jgi:subtilase family serine protease
LKLAKSRLVSITVAIPLLLIVLQTVPASAALVANRDSLPSRAIPGFRVAGAAPDSLPVTASIAVPLRNLGLLSSLVKQVSDPASPMFRHFLSQRQLTEDFYPTAKFNQLMQYLSTTGLQVQFTALDSAVVVHGTAAQVEKAFGTDLRVYSNGSASYYMSTSQSFMGAYLFASNSTALMLRPAVADLGTGGANVTFTQGSFSPKLLQGVYNATSLYSMGFDGSGKTIGILDFYGSPTIASDLRAFDKKFGFPDSNLSIIPIGPYDPNLGAYAGWSTEISIDVEMSHAMAPGAAVDLYVASNALSLSDVVSKIVKDDKVNTLSQSFTIPEWGFNYAGPGFFDLNALMPDQYYMLGALKGITFTAATGDTGGTGGTSGTEGELGYPSDSPFVTATGGTQTYFAGSKSVQTGWSDLGFVPNHISYGGSTGGVSILEPKPWYQDAQRTPGSFPAGRMNPDLSLQSGVDPASEIVDSGQVIGEGGTSEASPLLAGLVTLLDSSVNASAGLINPFLYSVGDNATTYTDGFTPISFGYTVPWVAAKGYNLVTGWGAPNIGEMSELYGDARSRPGLNVTVSLYPGNYSSGLEYVSGNMLRFNATIMHGTATVSNGSFAAALVTLTNETQIPLRYNASEGVWTGLLRIQNQSGIAYVEVRGSSGGVSGSGFSPLFAGFFGLFLSPAPIYPWSTLGGLQIEVESTTLDGNATLSAPLQVQIDTYSIGSNSYSKSAVVTLPTVNSSTNNRINEATFNRSIPSGPSVMVTEGGTYGYLPFVSGIYLQTTLIYPPVLAEPGSAAPGQELTIVATPLAPVNLYFLSSQETGNILGSDVAVGSNVTARLVSPDGKVVSRTSLAYQSCKEALRVCAGGALSLNGYLTIPQNASPGLYTVLLNASYSSETVGKTINGSFFSQVWVPGGPAQTAVSLEPGFISASAPSDAAYGQGAGRVSPSLYEGEHAHLVARIAYANGTVVKYGEYSAVIYPQSLEDQYTSLMRTEYVNSELVQLAYDPSLQAWLGNVTLPGPAYEGVLAPLSLAAFSYSGPYDVYVTGITSDGMVTTTALAAQQPFFIQPYVFVDGGNVTSLIQNSQFAFSRATITASGTLDGDIFIGTNVVQGGPLTITRSQIQGSLEVRGANVNLTGVSGGNLSATDSTLFLKDSSVGSLSLTGSRVVLVDSSYESVSPPLPRLTATGLSQPITGAASYNVTVEGSSLGSGSLSATIDGANSALQVSTTPTGLAGAGTVNATSLGDGVHTLVLTAVQSDGLSSTLTLYFSTDSRAASLEDQLSQARTAISSIEGQLATSKSSVGTLYEASFVLMALAIAAIALGVLALWRKPTPD